ncbi:MAG: PAS domain-containing protein [Pseudomonadota bacterium]
MGDGEKSKTASAEELDALRRGIAEFEQERAGTTIAGVREELLHLESFHELYEIPRPIRIGSDTTESIELKSLYTRDVTTSGSFDVRSGIWATTFGKVIQALPIPTFLVDENLKVAVVNQACGRLTPRYEKVRGEPFSDLVGGPSSASGEAESLLRLVLADRKPRVAEGALRIEDTVIWGRMTFRPIRIMSERYILVLVEDLTREKIQLRENEVLRHELERRVEQRTAQLRKTNEDLMSEVVERKRAQKEREKVIIELQMALAQVKKLSGLLPICASCKKIRDDQGYWQQIEAYIRDRSEAEFSHAICPECARRLYPDIFRG